MKTSFAFAAFFALALLTACGAKTKDPFTIEDAFIRAAPMKMSSGYVYITNNTAIDDALIGATSDWTGRIELHNITKDKDDVLTMTQIETIPLPVGQRIALRSGGLHLMLFDLKAPLEVGETRDITLQFAHSKPMTVTFKVKPITYKGSGSDKDAPMMEDHHH